MPVEQVFNSFAITNCFGSAGRDFTSDDVMAVLLLWPTVSESFRFRFWVNV